MRLTADFLPGTITIERGTVADYHALAHFHYARGKPATWAGVWRAVYRDFRFSIGDLRLEDERRDASPLNTPARSEEGDRASRLDNDWRSPSPRTRGEGRGEGRAALDCREPLDGRSMSAQQVADRAQFEDHALLDSTRRSPLSLPSPRRTGEREKEGDFASGKGTGQREKEGGRACRLVDEHRSPSPRTRGEGGGEGRAALDGREALDTRLMSGRPVFDRVRTFDSTGRSPSPRLTGEGEKVRNRDSCVDAGGSGDDPHLNLNRKSAIENRKSHQVIAVGVLSYPTPALRARERELGLAGPRYGAKLAFVNEHVRTISRVIVHPQFRGMGIASVLVRRICEDCPVRYVEAIAAMGEVHPFFEIGGMRRIAGREGEAAYFLWDRDATPGRDALDRNDAID